MIPDLLPQEGAYVRFNPGGRIIETGSMPRASLDAAIASGAPVLRGTASPERHWVKDGVIIEKTDACPAVLDGFVLSGLPIPSTLVVEGALYEVEDGTAELEFAHPGTYAVTVISGPFLDRVYEVVVP